jgi:lysophospholipase L1-like esterase
MKQHRFDRMVVIGDSIAYGMCSFERESEWAQVTARLLRKFHNERLLLFNRGIPANVLSPRCPGYEESVKPSLIERYKTHCIDLAPDLVIIAEGTNDVRSGMNCSDYIEDMETVITDIQQKTEAAIVLLGVYYFKYGEGANDPKAFPTWSRWSYENVEEYNSALKQLSKQRDLIFVDSFSAMGRTDWLLNSTDYVHLNDLGHTINCQEIESIWQAAKSEFEV